MTQLFNDEQVTARAACTLLRERGLLRDDDAVMLIGATVSGFGHSRSDLDLLVLGSEMERLPLHTFLDDRRVDVDFIDPKTWYSTIQSISAMAGGADGARGETLAPIEDRDWWSDRFWLYDRVLHGIVLFGSDAANRFRMGASRQILSTAIANYWSEMCQAMMLRASMHRMCGNMESACQYEFDSLLAAADACSASRGVVFWSDRAVLARLKLAHENSDPWDVEGIESILTNLLRGAWGQGPDGPGDVVEAISLLLGTEREGQFQADFPAVTGLRLEFVPGWKEELVGGDAFLLSPDNSLYSASPAAARLLHDSIEANGQITHPPQVTRLVVGELLAAGAAVCHPSTNADNSVVVSSSAASFLLDACQRPLATSPGNLLSSRVAAQWYCITLWSLLDDLQGAVESHLLNRIIPILRKIELHLRMLTLAMTAIRSNVTRNLAMDLADYRVEHGFVDLLGLVQSHDEDIRSVPKRVGAVVEKTMMMFDLPVRADMFERGRNFRRTIGDVRKLLKVADSFGLQLDVPPAMAAKGASVDSTGSTLYLDPSR